MKIFTSVFMRFVFEKGVNMVLLIYLLLIVILPCECSIKKTLLQLEKAQQLDSSSTYQKNSSVSHTANPTVPIKNKHNNYGSNKNSNIGSGHIVIPLISNKKSRSSTKQSEGFFKSALKYFLSSKAIESYVVKIKADLSNYIETERQKLFSPSQLETVSRQFQGAPVPKPSWMESAMVPMAFITFAMFLMDIMQRMFPYYGGGFFGSNDGYYDYYNRVQMPVVTTEEPYTFKISSLFGRSIRQKSKRNNLNVNAAMKRPTATAPTTISPEQKDKQRQSIKTKLNNINRHSFDPGNFETPHPQSSPAGYYVDSGSDGSTTQTSPSTPPSWNAFNYDYQL